MDPPPHNPTPFPPGGDRALRWLVGLAAATVVVGGIKAAAPLVTQLLVMAFLAIVLTPCYHFLRRRRLPGWLASALLILAVAGASLYVVCFVLPPAVIEFAKKVPAYHRELVGALDDLAATLRESDIDVPEAFFKDLASIDAAGVKSVLLGSVSKGSGLLGNLVLILIVVCFYFAELPRLPATLSRMRWLTPERRAVVDGFVRNVRHYMGIKASVSAATGLCVYAGLKLLGVDSPVLLGFVAFFLNFVPAVGSLIAAVPGVLLALSSGGMATAVGAAVLYLAANQLLGNVLEPRIMGSGFGVSPVVVMLSVVFWGWVLGPVGMLLAVPLTLAVRGAAGTAAPVSGASRRR